LGGVEFKEQEYYMDPANNGDRKYVYFNRFEQLENNIILANDYKRRQK
jgi:hypothetical protein